MGNNYFPDNKTEPNGIAILTNPIIKGTADLQGLISKSGVTLTSVPADLNLLSGYIATGFTPVKCLSVLVDCSGAGTAQTATIGIIPAGSLILDVMTYCTEAFNSGSAHTFEVGIGGNTDKYIDPSDCPHTLAGVMDIFIGTNQDQKTMEAVTAALTLIATWTNTAAATAGKMLVKVIYC
jgi:hypothetical protein